MHAGDYRPRLRRDYIKGGVAMRVCQNCRKAKPHDVEHFSPLSDSPGLARTCRKCRSKASLRARHRQMEREGDRLRARHAKQARERRKNNPEVKAREAAARKRWREKIKADPQRRAGLLETERMARRLAKEREGKGTGKAAKAMMSNTAPSYLPSAPLVALIDRIVDQRAEAGRVLNDPSGVGPEAVCEDLCVSSRTYRRWHMGEQPKVRVGTAEAVLMAAGVDWHEVYSYDDHAHIFLADEVSA